MLQPDKTTIALPDGSTFETPLRHNDGTLSYTLAFWNTWMMPDGDYLPDTAGWVIAHMAGKMASFNRIKLAQTFNMVAGPSLYVCSPKNSMRCLTPSWIPDHMPLEHLEDRLRDAHVARNVLWDVVHAISEVRANARLVDA